MEIAGYASVGSRSAMTVSHALIKTVEAMLAKGKTIAATVLETAEADIEYRDGRFGVVGTDRSISLFDLAARAKEMKKRGEIAEDLDTKTTAETPLTFPNGCHIAEVEIDPATGALALVGYTAVDDCGNALNRMIVEGQTHGSIAQGLGQAMMEHAIFDRVGRPAGHRLVHGLCDAARRRHAARSRTPPPRSGDDQPARRQGRGRSRHHRRDRRGDERRRRRHSRRRRRASRHAGDAGEDLARRARRRSER